MKKLMAHPVLVPGFPDPKSKVFSSIPQIFMDSDCGQRTVRCWGHNNEEATALFLSFSTLESFRFLYKETPVFSLIVGVSKELWMAFLI